MQYFYLPALVTATATGMLANAAPVSNGQSSNKAAGQGFQPMTPASTRAGAPLVVQWKPDTSGSKAWKKMDISLVSIGKDGKKQSHKIASGVDGTNASNSTIQAHTPNVKQGSDKYFVEFSHAGDKDPKKSQPFTIESADSKYAKGSGKGSNSMKARHDSDSSSTSGLSSATESILGAQQRIPQDLEAELRKNGVSLSPDGTPQRSTHSSQSSQSSQPSSSSGLFNPMGLFSNKHSENDSDSDSGNGGRSSVSLGGPDGLNINTEGHPRHQERSTPESQSQGSQQAQQKPEQAEKQQKQQKQ